MLKYLSRLLGQQQTTNDNLQKTDTYRQITRPVIVEPDLSQGYNYTEATYIRETGRNLRTRLIEHKGATRNGDVTINHIGEHYSTSFQGSLSCFEKEPWLRQHPGETSAHAPG